MESIVQQGTCTIGGGYQTAGRWGLGRGGGGMCESIAHPDKIGQVRGGTGHYGNTVI